MGLQFSIEAERNFNDHHRRPGQVSTLTAPGHQVPVAKGLGFRVCGLGFGV